MPLTSGASEAEAVEWRDGCAIPSGPNAGDFDPMPIKEIASRMGQTGGPIVGHFEATPEGAGVSFATHIVDAEVDRETGATAVTRYTVVQERRQGDPPVLCRGAIPGRRGAGDRLGAERRVHL